MLPFLPANHFRSFALILVVLYCLPALSQSSDSLSVDTRLHFKGDFRFRVEYDWHSRKSDGSFRTDRTRLRYRLRFGFTKNLDSQFSVGARIRTGNLADQQGPHVTLGGTPGEFGTTQIGFEKAYLHYQKAHFWAWLGKKDYPFWKQHELLWNDNTFPEGVALGTTFRLNENIRLAPAVSHFIFNASNRTFDLDAFISSVQLTTSILTRPAEKLVIHLGELYFHSMPDIPDGQQTYTLPYNILTASAYYAWFGGKRPFSIGADVYHNTTDYPAGRPIPALLQDERTGFVFYLKYGKLANKGDYSAQAFYANIQKYSVVDYLAQNDWARWDYSQFGVSGARLSNFHGFELRFGYQLTKAINLISRFYLVEQLVKLGDAKESGSRFRIDLNAKF